MATASLLLNTDAACYVEQQCALFSHEDFNFLPSLVALPLIATKTISTAIYAVWRKVRTMVQIRKTIYYV